MRSFLLKLSIGVAGLIALVFLGSIDFSVLARATGHPGLLAAAFICLLATVPIAAFRWWMLLRGLQFSLTLGWSVVTTFVGIFFNTFLPGAYGGDLVRLAMAYRAAGDGLNRLTFSVIVDRLSGLTALLILALVQVPFLPAAYAERIEWVAGVSVVAGGVALALASVSGDLLARLAARIPSSIGSKISRIISELTSALRAYLARPGLILAAVATSLIQWSFVLVSLIILGEAMQFKGLSWSGYVIAGVWSLVANALPITPGGIGVGEAAFAHVANILSSAPADAAAFGTVFLAMRVLTTLVGVIAILPWMLHRVDLRQGLSALQADSEKKRTTAPAAK